MQIDILYNLANTEVMTENHNEAIQKYELVLKYLETRQASPDLTDETEVDNMKEQQDRLLFNLANSYSQLDDLENSLLYFEKSIAFNENNVESLLGLAKVYQKMQKYKLAIDLYDKANKLLPESDKE